jgi:hypothetical protein
MSPSEESEPLLVASSPDPHTPTPGRKQVSFVNQLLLLFFGAILFSIFSTAVSLRRSFDSDYPSHTGIQFASRHFWGAYSPYFPAKKYIPPPSHCHITQVRWFFFVLISSLIFLEQVNIVGVPILEASSSTNVETSHIFRFNDTVRVFQLLAYLHVSPTRSESCNPQQVIPTLD